MTVAGSCREAEAALAREAPHLILLDVMLPDGDGFSFFERLQKSAETPVIFLSARDEDENRLRGLGLGADDYVTNPFLPEELILRVKAVLKRAYRARDDRDEVVVLGDVTVDLASGAVRKQGQAASEGAAQTVGKEAGGSAAQAAGKD